MNEILNNITPALSNALILIIIALSSYIVTYISKKKKVLQLEMDSALAIKYTDMIEKTIIDCVNATNQTYVEALKKDNAFTKEAQAEAFNRTLNSVMKILSDDCLEYLAEITTDVNAYIYNKIEAEVNYAKVA